MTDLDLYISRKPAEKWLDKFGKALKQPAANPLVFYAYGIGGIGKSTLLGKLRETYAKEAKFARVSFGPTSKIDSPLALMEHLYKQLPDDGWGDDPFIDLCREYKETLNQLKTELVEEKGSTSLDQINLVKKLLGGTAKWVTSSWGLPDQTAEQLGSAAEGVVDVASLALSEKDRIEQFLKQYRVTKNKRALQELMLDPLPKLTQAFAERVIQQSQRQPILLELDTYEKASSEFDMFLCKYFLGDTALQSYPIRIVMAGRYSLKNKRYQRMFLQHWSLIDECQLEKFDRDETKRYLKEIGIVQSNEVRRFTQATKGLPYFLRLIKDQKESGRSLSTWRDSDEIVDRLLDGLTATQRRVVQLASYCRWFDRRLIQYLVNANLPDNNQSTEEQTDWFDWLTERDFVISEDTYRVDDVARDVIRAAEHRADEQNFRHIHDLLAQYFQQLADQEVDPERPAPAKYENSDWCRYAAEIAYHALFANRDKGQFRLLTYFFEGAYLKQPTVALQAFTAVAAEAEPADNNLLPRDNQSFLENIRFAITFGWCVVDEHPNQYEFKLKKPGSAASSESDSIKVQIESALEICFRKVDRLMGLAKYTGLIGKALRCHSSQQLTLIQQAKEEAEKIIILDYLEFSSNLFLKIGDSLNNSNRHQESIDSYNKAIELNPDYYLAWHNRGSSLGELEKYEEALNSYNEAIELNPDYYLVWHNRGSVLGQLEQYEKALNSYNEAIKLNPNYYLSWYNRGSALRLLRRYDEAITSLDEALKITRSFANSWNVRGLCLSFLKRYDEAISNIKKARNLDKDKPLFLANQGIVLARAGRYEDALGLCEQALKLKEDESGYYAQACCYALQGHAELAIEALERAIEYAPHQCRLEARCNPDFDSLQSNEQFQALIEPKTQ